MNSQGPIDFGAQIAASLASVQQQQNESAAPAAHAAPAPEAAAPAPTPAVDPDMEKRFAKLNSASAKLQEERRALNAEREQMRAEFAELMQIKEFRDKGLAKEDPVAWARFGGFDAPDEYATTLIEKGQLTPERRRLIEQERELADLKNWRNQQEKQAQEAAMAQAQARKLEEIKSFGTSEENFEKFDLVNRFNAHNLVLNEIATHYARTMDPETGVGEELTLEQAYEIVESRIDKELAPALESPKLRSRLGARAPQAPAQSVSALPATPRHPTGPTITSRMRAQATTAPRQLSEQERLEAAFNILLGTPGR